LNLPEHFYILINILVQQLFTQHITLTIIAGCGTGHHSVGTVSRFKNSNVLAIDLSLYSLAYVERKTEELGVQNMDYMQADILDLSKLGRIF
tara:strand:+ start:612 stop:887 length:276 start_codon:yes stop_codon:yes gene_type:complete